jgi:HSP20 family protein
MPSIRYINQSAPFWDFVANMEREGTNHPLFGGRQRGSDSEEEATPSWGPWGFPGGFTHRPHPHHGPGHHHGPPPPPPGADVPPPPFTEKEDSPDTVQNEKGESSAKAAQRDGAEGPEHRRRCGSGGFGGRGRCGKRGGPHGFGRGPWARGGFPFGPFAAGLAGNFWNENKEQEEGEGGDGSFKPDVDVFDTENAYVLHLSLPGVKKEDVSVTWDAEKSEVAVSGIVHRPGDEEFLKTLAMDERKVGLFERKVRLGSLANPAQVEVDAISAKLEDGILRIEVPKQDKDYVEVKMVDIE